MYTTSRQRASHRTDQPDIALERLRYRLCVDFGTDTLWSAAGLTAPFDLDELVGSRVVAVVGVEAANVVGFEPECPVVGVDGDGRIAHRTTEREIPDVSPVY